jgi:transcriptional regulator with XRE-family HTH domain
LDKFAEYIGVSRPLISYWLKGTIPSLENVQILANKFGPEVYDVLGLPRPNPYLQKINQVFERLSPEQQKRTLQEDHRVLSREIVNITNAIASAGHSQALLDALHLKETQRAQVSSELKELEIPIEPVPKLSQPQIESASKRLVERLKSKSLEERREVLRGIIHDVVADREGPKLELFITYYYPPPFEFAPTGSLSIALSPVGAHLYRQTFTYHVISEKKTRSK